MAPAGRPTTLYLRRFIEHGERGPAILPASDFADVEVRYRCCEEADTAINLLSVLNKNLAKRVSRFLGEDPIGATNCAGRPNAFAVSSHPSCMATWRMTHMGTHAC